MKNSLVHRIILIASCTLLLHVNLSGDPGYYDLFEIAIDDETYYFSGLSRGGLKSDLRYYTAEGEYLYDVDAVFRHYFPHDSVTLFKNMDSINVEKFSRYSYGNNHIYNFTNAVTFSSAYFLEHYEIRNAYNVHAAPYQRFTRELKTTDNDWIQQNEIQKLFEIQGKEEDDYRTYEFFAIAGSVSEAETEALEEKLDQLVYDQDRFYRELSRLYERRIVMLCVCWE